MPGGSNKGTRKRWATKVKSGCISCKKRRVKCDEAKPECRNCTNRRIACEGYEDFTFRPSRTEYGSSSNDSISPGSDVVAKTLSSESDKNVLERRPGACVQAISTWMARTPTPFQTREELSALQTWLAVMPGVARSEVGLTYWTNLIPTLAWSHPAIRHAMTATALTFVPLLRGDSAEAFSKQIPLVSRYARTAIGLVRRNRLSSDMAIVLATLFWIMESELGNYTSSMRHLASAHKMAQGLSRSTVDPLIARYVRAFVDSFPASVSPKHIKLMSEADQETQFQIRARLAKSIMSSTLAELLTLKDKIAVTKFEDTLTALKVVMTSYHEFNYMYQRWPIGGNDNPNPDDHGDNEKLIREHSPFVTVLSHLENYITEGSFRFIDQFEIEFRPVRDHFLSLIACHNLKLRSHLSKMLIFHQPTKKLTKLNV